MTYFDVILAFSPDYNWVLGSLRGWRRDNRCLRRVLSQLKKRFVGEGQRRGRSMETDETLSKYKNGLNWIGLNIIQFRIIFKKLQRREMCTKNKPGRVVSSDSPLKISALSSNRNPFLQKKPHILYPWTMRPAKSLLLVSLNYRSRLHFALWTILRNIMIKHITHLYIDKLIYRCICRKRGKIFKQVI